MFPAGKYYVGDPCYVFSRDTDTWSKLLDHTEYFENDKMEFNGHPIWARGTAYGDGTYSDQDGREYGVDAGLIGIVSIELFERDMAEIITSGHIIEFTEPFEPKEEDGLFTIGHITIDTDDEEDNEDEDDTCWECGNEYEYCSCNDEDEDEDIDEDEED